MTVIEERKSVCPACLKVLDAQIVRRDEDVYLEKTCPEHGEFSTVIWRGDSPSWEEWNSKDVRYDLPKRHTITAKGCPYDCGLCPSHNAPTCSVLFEATERCNLGCSVCFASSETGCGSDVPIETVRQVFQNINSSGGPFPLQLSGGEPTVRDDLPEIVSIAKTMGFPHVQVNTNGLRIADDIGYLHKLKEAGLDLVYLQCDGVSDTVYLKLRRRPMADIKRKVLENCAEMKIGVQLVPTVIRSVNDHELGGIVALAKEFMPVVKGIHFQPVSYFGRYGVSPSNETRETTPDVLRSLETQTAGEVKAEHFLPRHKHDAHCGFSAFYILASDGRLRATTFWDPYATEYSVEDPMMPAEHVREFIISKSRYIEEPGEPGECECIRAARLSRTLLRAKKFGLSISGMPFMDAWTLDLERLRNCCIHIAKPDGRIVPFCANYLTDKEGQHMPEFR